MSRSPLIAVISTMAVLSLACAKQGALPPAVPATYRYSPTPTEAGRGVSIALIAPSIGDTTIAAVAANYQKLGAVPPADIKAALTGDPAYRGFSDAIGRSIVEYFTASGFTVSGPFQSVDEMTFPEKKQADLVLTIVLNTSFDHPRPIVGHSSWDGRVNSITTNADCVMGGGIDLVMWEPLSMQRMWAKSVKIEDVNADCSFNTNNAAAYTVLLGNAMTTLYEAAFKKTMSTAERYFSPEEVALVKSQAQELRDRKVY